jgi:sigma-B regulation protein RsbQ
MDVSGKVDAALRHGDASFLSNTHPVATGPHTLNMNALKRNNVIVSGHGKRPMVFSHGFGCDQQMWRFVAPAFAESHRVVLFDHIGCGKSDLSFYDNDRHATLHGYALDMVEILEQADLHDAIVVGHSVGSIIGMLAANMVTQRVSNLVLVAPSPRYLNDPPDYIGGFERADIEGLIDMMESNMLGWINFLAPVVMGSQAAAHMTRELKDSFCASDPYVTRRFALAAFLGDHRASLAEVTVPSLIIQCSDDAIAPQCVGEYMHNHIQGSRLRVIDASGHCPHMTHPEQTIALIRHHLGTE